jgi:hypothetical protein
MNQQLVSVRELRARDAPVLCIRRAQDGETATLVVKQGGRMPLHLVFAEMVTVAAVTQYVEGQCGWVVAALPVSVDGVHYEPQVAGTILLVPSTEKIEYGTTAPAAAMTLKPRQLEYRLRSAGHG